MVSRDATKIFHNSAPAPTAVCSTATNTLTSGPISAKENNRASCERKRAGERRPVVVGCTMIDMHVSTKVDDQFRVSCCRYARARTWFVCANE